MIKKLAALAAAGILAITALTGCSSAQSSAVTSDQATAENPMVLTLAHGLSETHTVHIAMTQFADEVKEKTGGRIIINIFPNGQLGSETENLEQLQAGVIAMTKVSAPGLATYNEAYNAFGLPYLFDDEQDFYQVMDSQEMRDFFLSTKEDGFTVLTYYTSGARSFYNKEQGHPRALGSEGTEDSRTGYEDADGSDFGTWRDSGCHVLRRCLYCASDRYY